MEINGIKLDNNFLKKLSVKFEKKLQDLEKQIFKISKKKFNIASTKQLGEITVSYTHLTLPTSNGV